MYEAQHAVRIMQLGRQLQQEMARTYQPDAAKIAHLCQEIETSAVAIYQWSRGIHGNETAA